MASVQNIVLCGPSPLSSCRLLLTRVSKTAHQICVNLRMVSRRSSLVMSGDPSSPEGHLESAVHWLICEQTPMGFTPFTAPKFIPDFSVWCLPGPKHLHSYWYETEIQQESGTLGTSGRGQRCSSSASVMGNLILICLLYFFITSVWLAALLMPSHASISLFPSVAQSVLHVWFSCFPCLHDQQLLPC